MSVTGMAKENATRKLAAILYADVTGYRRLTGDDDGSRMSGRGACALLLSSVCGAAPSPRINALIRPARSTTAALTR